MEGKRILLVLEYLPGIVIDTSLIGVYILRLADRTHQSRWLKVNHQTSFISCQ